MVQMGGTATREDSGVVTARDTSSLAPHLLPLAEGQWAIWRLACLRGTGFQAKEVLRLALSECEAADQVLREENGAAGARQSVLDALSAALRTLPANLQPEDRKLRSALVKSIHEVKKGQTTKLSAAIGALDDKVEQWRSAADRAKASRARWNIIIETSIAQVSAALREIVSDNRFREAIIWQNRQALRGSMSALVNTTVDSAAVRNSDNRRREEVVASYLQRYCMKNDTIGFFGPVGWARFVTEGEAIEVEPGPGLLATRNVYFEGWCIDALAERLAREPGLRPWLAPRRLPFVGLREGVMTLPGGGSLKLPAKEAAVLGACDGRRKARELAAGLMAEGGQGLKNEEEVYQCLETFCKRGVVAWTLEVPLARRAERRLRELLEGVGEDGVRRRGLAALDELEEARERVAGAAGDPERLDYELQGLEEKFSRLTGVAATRGAGQTYAARTLVYEDCRRDIEVVVGPAVVEALARPLSLLLQSARWMTHELAGMYRRAFRSVYTELAARTESGVVEAADFWIKCQPLFYKEDTRIADRIVPLFQERWMEALALPAGARRVVLSYEELHERVATIFAAPGPGWSHARYHSPDVMIAAASPAAIRRGEFHLVVGEVHLGVNCLNGSLFLGQHPRPEEVYEAITADFSQPFLVPVPPKNWSMLTARTSFEFVSPKNYRLLVSPDACGVAPSQALPISDLVVEEVGGELLLRTRDQRLRFEIVEGFGEFLSNLIMNFFHPLPPLRHTPRITVDRLTVSRETWRFELSELGFAFEADEAARFLGARRWQREFDLPRFLFAKSPVEKKPWYLDLDSPVLLNIFTRIVRRTKECDHPAPLITLTEMFPSHEDLWLPDAEGHRYTSELRMVALDISA